MMDAHAILAFGYDLGGRPRFAGRPDGDLPDWLSGGEHGLDLADVEFAESAERHLRAAGIAAPEGSTDGVQVITYGPADGDPKFLLAVKSVETEANTATPIADFTPPSGWQQHLAAAAALLGLDVADTAPGWQLAPTPPSRADHSTTGLAEVSIITTRKTACVQTCLDMCSDD